MELNGKTVLLTGASGGIGRDLAEELARAGARLILTGRNEAALKMVHAALGGEGHRLYVADLAEPEQFDGLVQYARQAHVDILINNAGVGGLALVGEIDPGQISRQIEINLGTPIRLCNALLPALKQRPEAMVVNIGSILGSIGLAGSSCYCASKFGLRGFSEALRRELADSSVRVIYFAPRATATSFNDHGTQALNQDLGNQVDSPRLVARQLIGVLRKPGIANHYLGWPEKLFVRINSVLPGLVDQAVKKQLPTIRRHATRRASVSGEKS